MYVLANCFFFGWLKWEMMLKEELSTCVFDWCWSNCSDNVNPLILVDDNFAVPDFCPGFLDLVMKLPGIQNG